MKQWANILALVVVTLLSPPGVAEQGVSSDEIVLGQSCALTGPAQRLGLGMRAGMLAYFNKVSENGGIRGRKIRLVSLDDGYEPDRAIQNTRTLINDEKVFLLIGEVGTPTSKAVVPIAEEYKVPFVGPFTGAEFLRNPYKKYVVNVRGSYYQEMEKLAEYLVDHKGLKKIACFYQNDGYGQAGLNGIKLALERRGMELVSTGTYERNSTAVKMGLLKIRKGSPEAVVMVGAYKPCSEFIKMAHKVKMEDVVYCNISFVGSEALLNELGEVGEGCVISQVVQYPWTANNDLIRDFQKDMKLYQPEESMGFVPLEGYMAARLFCKAIEKIDGEITRESFLQAIAEIRQFDLGGPVLEYGPNDNQGMDKVYLTVIRNKKIIPLEDLS